MSLSIITLLVVAVICLLLGGIAGMLFGSAGGQQEEDGESSADIAPPGGRKGGYILLARLWREKKSGALVVEQDGRAYLAPGPLSADQKEKLASTAQELNRWIGNPAAAPVDMSPPPVSRPVSSELLPAVPRPEAVIAPVPAARKPGAPPAKAPVQTADAPKSMVEQINAILQEQIAGTPFEALGISLIEDPVRGVVVWVGATSYDGIGEVINSEVQEVLRFAVAEWERRDELARRIRG